MNSGVVKNQFREKSEKSGAINKRYRKIIAKVVIEKTEKGKMHFENPQDLMIWGQDTEPEITCSLCSLGLRLGKKKR